MATEEDTRNARDFSALTWSTRGFLVLLGFPAFGLAFAVTVTSSYVPVLVEEVSNPLIIGLLVGGEGFFGMFVPLLTGQLSDRSGTLMGRLTVMVGSGAVLILSGAAIGVLAIVDAQLWVYAVALVGLYVGYYAFLAPYWALYPDLVPPNESGRSRSAESTWRVTGVGLALIGGGFLLELSPGLPFLVAGGLVLLVTLTIVSGLWPRRGERVEADAGVEGGGAVTSVGGLLRDPDIRNLAIANALWNFALSALRAFVVLFFVAGLGRSSAFVAGVIFPPVALGIAIAAPLSGWLADRFGHVRLLTVALLLYGGLMWLPAVTQSPWVVLVIPPVAAGAATVMTLPFSVLMRLLPASRHGAASGLFGLSRGIGGTLGPLVAGLAIMVLRPVLGGTNGYGAMWLVCSAALLISIPFLLTLRDDDRL